jgi:pantothenate synthetase
VALSSRNRYLSAEERAVAPELYRALQAGAQAARAGGTGAQAVTAAEQILGSHPQFRVQYVEAVDPKTLAPRLDAGPPLLLAAATFLGETRLIDNIHID